MNRRCFLKGTFGTIAGIITGGSIPKAVLAEQSNLDEYDTLDLDLDFDEAEWPISYSIEFKVGQPVLVRDVIKIDGSTYYDGQYKVQSCMRSVDNGLWEIKAIQVPEQVYKITSPAEANKHAKRLLNRSKL